MTDNHLNENYEAFQKLLPQLLKTDAGRHAVLLNSEVVHIFDTARDAVSASESLYEDGNYSVQEISNSPVSLGYWSYCA